ncbi:MAG: hypothetical protein B6226_05245 [Candidatus Cloacimonetes bacterium 4572_65]|nr:MAG: hypothetical protein B6226_05245 [Candidatus Cloacimonetes bacterium 4572_65]
MKRTYIYIILLMVFIIGCKSKNLEEIKVDEVVTESREKPTEPETIPTIEYSDDSSLSEEDVTVITPKKVNKKTNKEAPTVLKRVVYTKFNSWNLDADYFEIGFNKSIPESITEVELAKMITIKPYIKGKVTFVDRKRVRYYPNTPFHGNKMYSILVNQGELYNENIPSHSLSFYNQAPEISIESVGIKTQEDTGKNKIVLRVTSRYGKFTEERLKQNISYRIGRFSAFFSEVKYLSDGYILLETDYLEMNRNLDLTIDVTASQLYISQQSRFYYRNSINEMLRMAVQEIDTDTDKSGNVSISVKFNKNLDLNQPIVGLVRVLKDNKEVSVNISKYGSKIIITGNLKRKERYEVVVEKGVKSVDYSVTQVALKQEVFTYNITSSLQYIDDGIFVPSKDGESVNVEVVNNGRIDYEVWSIDYENVSEMLHHIKLGASELKDRGYYSRETLNWYGELEYSGKEKINCEVDVPFNVKIDLSSLVNQNREKNKIYILKINGDNGHYLKLNNKRDRRYRNYGRWSKSKLLIFSDYSISAKVIKNRAIIHVANVLTNKPVSRADVSLRSSSNRVIGKGLTDRDGRCEIYDTKEKLGSKEFFVVVEKDNSTSMLASQDMLLDNTKFNLKGEYETESIKLVAFLDREKYRPGEDINVSIILRGKLNEVIEKSRAAIKVTVYNPRNVKVSSQNVKDFISGFGVYTINTTSSSMTGRWRVVVEYGAKVEQLDFKLDTFVPDKIRVILETDKKKYGSNDTIVKATVKNNYLFGAALNNAMCELSLEYKSDENFATKSYSDYSFKDDVTSVDLEDKQMLRKIVTDGNGEVEYDLPLLETSDISVPYKLHITAKTSEDGGRFVTKKMILPAHNREHFIGLRQSRYLSSNKGEYSVDIVVIDSDGEEVDSSELEYKVYGKQESWWWDYGSNYRATFKRSSSTFVVTEGEFNYNSKNKRITFTPSNGGRTRSFMVEVRFKGDSEYQMNRHYFNSYWSDNRDIAEDNIVKLTTSKPKYKIGESIALSIPATKGNVIRLSVVGGSKIIKEEILNVRKTEEYIYQLEATKEMSPNVHIEVKVLQEMIDNNNDLPLRLYGIIPVMVYDPDTVLELEIDCPEQVNSQSSFKLSVDTGKKGKAQYVVSVVDEGLINKSRYRIPAIWNIFNKNRAYTAKDYDNFSMFLNSDNVEIFYNLLIGGDDFMNMESMMDSDIALSARGLSLVNALQETGVDRFKPLSLFYGVLETDENGVGVIDIDVPDYIGALKITVVAANKSAFGNAVTSVVVKDEIILVPTLPRILTPGDIIDIPLSVICDRICWFKQSCL